MQFLQEKRSNGDYTRKQCEYIASLSRLRQDQAQKISVYITRNASQITSIVKNHKMETYAFVKIANLPAYEKALIKSSTINEAITKLGITLGATIKLEAVTINTISMSREWSKRKSNSMETMYEIGPDHEPRSIYAVYQLHCPVLSSNSTYSIRTQCKEIIRHVAHKKPFDKHTPFTTTTFVFYACVSKEKKGGNMPCPKQFLVTEPHVELDRLQCDLNSWQCLHAESTRTRNKTAYVRLLDIAQQQLRPYNHDTIYNCAYLNAPKQRLCNRCRHEWSFQQLKDMIACSIKVPKEGSSLSKRIKALESTHSACGIWQLYFPSEHQPLVKEASDAPLLRTRLVHQQFTVNHALFMLFVSLILVILYSAK